MGSEEDGRSRIVCSTRLVRPFKHTTPRDFEEEEKGKNFLLEKRAERFSSSSLRHLSLSFFFLFIRSVISRPSSAISRPNLAGGSAKHGFLSPSPPLWARKHDITTIFDHHRLSTNFFGFNPRLFLARSNLSLFPEGSTWDPHKSHERDNFFPLPRDEKRRMMKEKKGKNFLIPRERTHCACTLIGCRFELVAH